MFKLKKQRKDIYYPHVGDVFDYMREQYEIITVDETNIVWRQILESTGEPPGEVIKGPMSIGIYLGYIKEGTYRLIIKK